MSTSLSSEEEDSETLSRSPSSPTSTLPYIVSPEFIKKLQTVLRDSFGTPRSSSRSDYYPVNNSNNITANNVGGNYSTNNNFYVFPGDKQYFDLYRISNRVNHVFFSNSHNQNGSQDHQPQFTTLYIVLVILVRDLFKLLIQNKNN